MRIMRHRAPCFQGGPKKLRPTKLMSGGGWEKKWERSRTKGVGYLKSGRWNIFYRKHRKIGFFCSRSVFIHLTLLYALVKIRSNIDQNQIGCGVRLRKGGHLFGEEGCSKKGGWDSLTSCDNNISNKFKKLFHSICP